MQLRLSAFQNGHECSRIARRKSVTEPYLILKHAVSRPACSFWA
jgi:hypothetical protein